MNYFMIPKFLHDVFVKNNLLGGVFKNIDCNDRSHIHLHSFLYPELTGL